MSTAATPTPIRAAGAVLWRHPRHDPYAERVEIALVHRPRYDDWSLPKGKAKPGEALEHTALREVKEETGMACVLGPPLPTTCYPAGGRPKEVHYWAAEATGGTFVPSKEVDRLIWLPPTAARIRLTHDRDRPLVDALMHVLRRLRTIT